jgi:hypothetical protein
VTRRFMMLGAILRLMAIVFFASWPTWQWIKFIPVRASLYEKTKATVVKNPRLQPAWDIAPIVASEGTGGHALLPRGSVRGSRQGKSVLPTGTTRSREVSARIGVTSDEAENAPRLRVANGEDSQESKPPVMRRVKTHTASPQSL